MYGTCGCEGERERVEGEGIEGRHGKPHAGNNYGFLGILKGFLGIFEGFLGILKGFLGIFEGLPGNCVGTCGTSLTWAGVFFVYSFLSMLGWKDNTKGDLYMFEEGKGVGGVALPCWGDCECSYKICGHCFLGFWILGRHTQLNESEGTKELWEQIDLQTKHS